MSNPVLLPMMGIGILIWVSLVNMMPVQSDSSNSSRMSTTAPDLEHFSLNEYRKMVRQQVGAMHTIGVLLSEHVRIVIGSY